MNKRVLVKGLLLMTFLAHGEIYKWVDNKGNVNFSDSPHQGSQAIILPKGQSYSTPKPALNNQVPTVTDDVDKGDDSAHDYTKAVMTQPTDQATVRNNDGYVVVAAEVEPELATGDNFEVLLDGAVVGKPQKTPLFQLNNVNRGTHTAAVQVVNDKGDVLITSDSVTFYMHRARAAISPVS